MNAREYDLLTAAPVGDGGRPKKGVDATPLPTRMHADRFTSRIAREHPDILQRRAAGEGVPGGQPRPTRNCELAARLPRPPGPTRAGPQGRGRRPGPRGHRPPRPPGAWGRRRRPARPLGSVRYPGRSGWSSRALAALAGPARPAPAGAARGTPRALPRFGRAGTPHSRRRSGTVAPGRQTGDRRCLR
jgi:hypothetical protein